MLNMFRKVYQEVFYRQMPTQILLLVSCQVVKGKSSFKFQLCKIILETSQNGANKDCLLETSFLLTSWYLKILLLEGLPSAS